ncbi:MAG: DEAD/DEAH box helicase [Thermodesulfobacteriota bacterium]|nr:DEAD/DEAH box helicase [Thermodesulfobacteriota bacterium]
MSEKPDHHRGKRKPHHRRKPPATGSKKRSGQRRLKPGSDPKLKKVFSTIGIPEPTPFTPDPFQKEALEAIKNADCIVTAPTGAGKTWIAEQVIERMLKQGRKTWYASPLKALSNAMYTSFSRLFGGENTGILTGDRKENPGAPVIIGTTEILRNQLYDAMYSGEDLDTDFVILDEAHFLGDTERGVVWEEVMIYLPRRIPMLLLSATIGNPEEIGGWLSTIRNKACRVVRETRRPVQLYPLILHPSGTLFPLLSGYGKPGKPGIYKKTLNLIQAKNQPRLAPPHRLPPMNDILRILRKYNLLPAIFFMKSRADCDKALPLCDGHALQQDPDREQRLAARVDEVVAGTPYLAEHKQLEFIKKSAVAAHHSGHLPLWKKCVETLMNGGYLDAVFATSTVAAGVNFPARTVVILNSDRFNGKEFLPLSPIEFHQMTGRAGRRGKDNIGFALLLPGKFMDIRHIAKLTGAKPSAINSQIKINFSMTLNLLLGHSPAQVKEMLKHSFALYQHTRKNPAAADAETAVEAGYLWQEFLRHLEFLQETGYADKNGHLTEDGAWASKLRVDHPVMIAEGFRRGLFPATDPALLAAVIASFVNERQNDDNANVRKNTSKRLKSAFNHVKHQITPFTKHMREKGFPPTDLYLAPALTIYQWAAGYPWDRVAAEADIEEGDLANLVFRTADNLRHIANLFDIFPDAARSANEAIALIMKEPVL